MTISLRPALPGDDDEFLFSVYASTRAEEMERVDWHTTQKQEFMRMQFRAQDHAYKDKENYPGAEFEVILLDGRAIGRLYVHRIRDEIQIMDISLLPQYRGQGIGTRLLNGILEEGTESNCPVSLYVERFNPAMHLYERLGFCQVSEQGVYLFMKWLPSVLEKHEDTRTTAKQ